MATQSIKLVKGRRIRLTRTDACGRPVFGESSQVTSKGFVSVALTANTIDTDEINATNASGERCVYVPGETSLAGYGVEIAFCEVDPELFALVTGNPVVYSGAGNTGDIIGFDVDTQTDLSGQGFALELWAGSAGGDACADPNAQGSYGYLLLPFLTGGIVGDFTVENDAVTFTVTGANTKDGNAWGVGPYKDVYVTGNTLGALPNAVGSTVPLRTMITNAAPPAPAVGARPVLDPEAEAVTSIAATVVNKVATITATPNDLATPFYYEFGDGTWDYLASGAMGATSHTYAKAGTYTIRASTNGTWVSTTVTVA